MAETTVRITMPSGNPVPETFRFPVPMPSDQLAQHYGMERPVIDALTHITGLFDTWASARYIVMPYGKSISVPDIAAALNRLYQAGQAAGPADSQPTPACPEGHNHHATMPPEPDAAGTTDRKPTADKDHPDRIPFPAAQTAPYNPTCYREACQGPHHHPMQTPAD